MRVEDAGARTWLLAAVAGWGLLAWLLAVFGMGSAIAPLLDDPGLLKPIPALPASSTGRLGPMAQYTGIGARPLFAEDRRPKAFSLKGDDGTDASQAFDYLLTSVLITPSLQLAILQSPDGSKSARVKLGEAPESHPAWRLSALNARSAVFDGPGAQRTIDLRVFDGTGGSPATLIGREDQPAAGVPMVPPADITSTPSSQPYAVPSAGAQPGTSTRIDPATTATSSTATEQSQMEAIRQRIQARRAQLRQQSQPAQPPAKDQ